MADRRIRIWTWPLQVALLFMLAGGLAPATAIAAERAPRLIVRLAPAIDSKSLSPVVRELDQRQQLDALVDTAGGDLIRLRETTAGALVVGLGEGVDEARAREIAAALVVHPHVLWAEPDRWVRSFDTLDPYFALQWNLQGPGAAAASVGGSRAAAAWARSQGAGAVVAVIDSGSTDHPDLIGAWLPGYDMIAADTRDGLATAGDGDGRDPDAADPGNWCESATGVRDRSWHGTAVAGIIAARYFNGYGIAGVAPLARVLPVRAIGRCGGYMSDVLDAMRWSAGLAVAGLPVNPNPARILNLSLGSSVDAACSRAEQATIDELAAAGVLVIAAAGNDGQSGLSSPASCRGAVAVGAHTRDGHLASYSNHHAGLALTAPGGSGATDATMILGSGNDGQTVVGRPIPARPITGTSAAAPHVAAAAALLLSIEPTLSVETLRNALLSTARRWPAGSRCDTAALAGLCGAGMLDIAAAVDWLDVAMPLAIKAPTASVVGGSSVTLSAAVSSSHYAPSQIRYQWTQRSGDPAVLVNADQATVRVTLPKHRTTVGLRVTATDPGGRVSVADSLIDVNNPPVVEALEPLSLAPGQRLDHRLSVTDPDGDALRFVLLQGPAGLTVGAEDGRLVWPAAQAGSHTVRIRVSDVHGLAAPELRLEIVVDGAPLEDLVALSPFTSEGKGGGGSLPLWLPLIALGLAIGQRWPARLVYLRGRFPASR